MEYIKIYFVCRRINDFGLAFMQRNWRRNRCCFGRGWIRRECRCRAINTVNFPHGSHTYAICQTISMWEGAARARCGCQWNKNVLGLDVNARHIQPFGSSKMCIVASLWDYIAWYLCPLHNIHHHFHSFPFPCHSQRSAFRLLNK